MQPEIAEIPEQMTTAEMFEHRKPVYEFEGDFANIFRLPGKGFTAMIYGKPGEGKSTLCLQLAEYFGENWGDVLYVSGEEYATESLLQNVDRNDTKSIFVTWRADYNTDLSQYDFVFFDSINNLKMKVSDFVTLKKMYPNTAMLLIFQSVKNGDFRGGQDWQHEVDTVIEVKDGNAESRKRYSPNNGELFGIFK